MTAFSISLEELPKLCAFLTLKKGTTKTVIVYLSATDRIVCSVYPRRCSNLFQHTYQDKHNCDVPVLKQILYSFAHFEYVLGCTCVSLHAKEW